MSDIREYTGYTKVAVDSGFAVKAAAATIAANINALRNDAGLIKLSGSTIAFNLNGVQAGVDGQRLLIYHSGAGVLTIQNQATAAAAANRIVTVGTATSIGPAAAELVYDASASRWVCINFKA